MVPVGRGARAWSLLRMVTGLIVGASLAAPGSVVAATIRAHRTTVSVCRPSQFRLRSDPAGWHGNYSASNMFREPFTLTCISHHIRLAPNVFAFGMLGHPGPRCW